MNRKEIEQKILDYFGNDLSGTEVLLLDGLDSAFIGLGQNFDKTIAIYDRQKCIEVLMEEHSMTDVEAVDYFEYNVTGQFLGPNNPVFVELF